jgi:hypothetical protein
MGEARRGGVPRIAIRGVYEVAVRARSEAVSVREAEI